VRRISIVLPALICASCAEEAPLPKPPPPPPPSFQAYPASPPERLSIEGYYSVAEGGRHPFEIYINQQRVIAGALTAVKPRGKFHGTYDTHDVLAECSLTQKVHCAVSIDGAPEKSAGAEAE